MNGDAREQNPDAATDSSSAPIISRETAERWCSVEGCERAPTGRGWCHKHYERWRRTGDPEGTTRKPKPPPPTRAEVLVEMREAHATLVAHVEGGGGS